MGRNTLRLQETPDYLQTISQKCLVMAKVAKGVLGCIRKSSAHSLREVILPALSNGEMHLE